MASVDVESTETIYKKARSIGADYYCSRSFVDQNGYGRLQQGHRIGMSSITAMIADALVGEWHGVFKADNGWLYVAVHADNVAPDGDRFFRVEEEAYAHFMEKAKGYKWPKSYAPANWNLNNSDGEIELSQIVDDIPSVQLKPTNINALFGGTANKNLALIILAIFIGLLFLSVISQSLFNAALPERISDPSPSIEVRGSLTVPPQRIDVATDPIQALIAETSMPRPSAILVACVENFDDLMVSIPGWNIDLMRCRGNFVEAIWRRGVGNLETLQSSLSELPFGVSKTYGSSGDFLASRVINIPQEHMNRLELSQREQALIALNNRFSGFGNLQVRDIRPESNQRRNRVRQTQQPGEARLTLQDIPSLNVILRTEMSPEVIKENVNIPGLKFNIIEWDMRSGLWAYDMQIYLFPENHNDRQG